MRGRHDPLRWIAMLGLCHLLLAVSANLAQSPQCVASEKVLGTVDLAQFDPKKKPTFWISPDGRRVAWMTEKGIVIDGQAKEYAYGVKPESFSFSSDGKHAAYVAKPGRAE